MLNVEKNKKIFWFNVCLFLIVIGLFYITYMRYSKFFEIDNDGYIFTSNKIVEKLYNQSLPENESKIDYKKVTSKDTLYKKNDKYYIGENNKNEVVINYPIISENGSRVTVLNKKNTLINDKFTSINAFNNAIITNGYLYNGVSLDKVNDDNYILIGVDSNIYVNTVKIKIIKNDGTYVIPENSIVYFLESEIRYYYLNNGTFKYARIGAINDKDTISYNDTSMEYYEYLDNLGLIEKIEDIPEEKVDDDEVQTPTDEVVKPNDKEEEEEKLEETNEEIYIKPEVTGIIEKVNTYTLFLNTDIKDPSGKITTLPTYEIIYNNNTYSRKTVYFSGQTKITGLIPNTEFSIIGYYIYKDQNGKSLKKIIIDESFKTGNIDNLNSINLSYNNDNIYSNKIEISNLKITNNNDDEVLNGIKNVEVVVNDQIFNLGNDQANNLKKLNEIIYKTANVLDSNTIYNVTINFYDSAGNLLKSTNNKFQTKTAKQEPTCKIQIESTDLTKFTANLVFSNPDDIVLNNLKYIVTDMKNTILKEGSITKDKIFIDDLDANSIYNFSVYADYDIEDGKGLKTNVLLNTTKVSTTPISNLGLVRYTFNEKNISQNDASYDIVLDTVGTNKKLIDLLDEVNIEITDSETNELITNIKLKDEDIISLKSGAPFNIKIDGLLSMTTYNINVTNIIRQGSKTYEVSSKTNLNSFKTLKKAAEIEIVNRFFNENMIDFDVRVSDPDGAIETDRVILEVRDENDTLVKIEILDINDDYKRLSFTKLEKEKNYKFTYIAETYNEGYSKNGYIQDKKLLEEKIKTEVGIYGSLELESVLKEITSKNLFDIASTKRWKKDGTSTIDSKQMDILDKTINLSAKNGYANYSYYLPEAKGNAIRVTFDVKYADGSMEQNVYLSNGAGSNKQFELNDLTHEYKSFTFVFGLNNNGYFGFYVDEITNNNTTTTIEIKDLDVQVIASDDYPTQSITDSYYDKNYIFTDGVMYNGLQKMPTFDGKSTMDGNKGNGYAKITDLETNIVTVFEYTGKEQVFDVPDNHKYKVELWGAAGGDGGNAENMKYGSHAGRGGYTSGIINLKKGTKLYVYVGEKGKYGSGSNVFSGPLGGWNGGGIGGNSSSGSGGGSTDIRLVNGKWNSLDSLKTRIMVAGAGGGGDNWGGTYGGGDDGRGGAGGGLTAEGAYINGIEYKIYAGGQYPKVSSGYFGYAAPVTTSTDTGGGGGGWYGGGPTNNNNGGGGGGSSYISGYMGCISYSKINDENSIYNNYNEKDRYNSTLYANLYDTQNQLDDKNFYIELYNKGELEDTYSYPMDSNIIENYLLYYELKKNTDYEIVINVKIRGRLYAINSIDVSTEDETRAIKSVDDFFAMHSNGKYVVTEDLDFRNSSSYYSANFTGKIDFQGHSIYIDAIKSSRLMHYVSYEAVLKNIDAHFYFDNTTSSRSYFYGLVYDFRGLMSNVKLTVETTNNKSNLLISLACETNRGIIENFVVNNKSGFSGERTIGFIAQYNRSIIRNGYLYGENIDASFPKAAERENKRIGAVAAYASEQSKIVNIYSLIGINGVNPLDSTNYDLENRIGSLVGEQNRGIVSNSYSYTSGNNRVSTRDANIGVVSSTVSSNDLYYVSDDSIFAANQSTKVSKLALRDKDFQNVINGDDMFEIDDYVTYGYYPHIKWPDSMPVQEYIQLPKTNDKDLIDILNTKSVKTNDDGTATVILNINNPAADEIASIKIKDINTVDIINQENDNGKSKLTIKLSNPIKYISKYNIMSITAKNGYGKTYTQEYENNEKVILIDLYRIINNVSDLKLVNTYYNENFMLNTDFDFEGTNQSAFVINSYYGKFNGNGHTIKNVTITSGKGFIQNLYGTVMNLKFENIKRTTSSINNMYGLVGQAYTNSVIDNIHIKDTSFIATERMAALVGYSDGAIIKNCSATNVSNLDVTGRVDIKVGGLVAQMYNTIVENCYTQNVNFDTTPSTITYAVGGLVGLAGSGSISDAYSTGDILSGYQNAGGLVGYNSSTIKNSYTNVEISSKEEYVGGIAGYSSTTAISNVLATGSIYTSSIKKNIKRIAGSQDISKNAFAWAEQYVDGFYTGQSNGERLLTTDDLSQKMFYEDIIELGAFNYDDLDNGKLPKLYSTDGKTLLPNQEDNFLKEKAFTIKSIKVIKEQDTATVDIQIDNPNNYEVKNIEVDGLNTTIRKLQTVDGITRIELYVTPIKYYDSYGFKSFVYKDENGNDKKFKLDGKIPVQFFKKLSTYTDWQAISSTDAENYLLVNDIDFDGKTNIKTNVIFNRLIVRMNEDGSYDPKTIKNMTINVSGSDKYLINRINCEMSNIIFDNIKFTNTSTSNISNNGLIGYAFGDFYDNAFNNINLTLTKATYAGVITFDRSDEIRDISLNNVTVTGRGYVSGFISRSIARAINNISYDTINVTATENYSGGIIAYMDWKENPDIYNINGVKSTVTSKASFVGSIFGYGGCNGVNASNSTVKGVSYVGGIAGQAGVRNLRNAVLNSATITATGNNTGGIAGSSENIISSYANDLTITSSGNNVGGIGGTGGYTISTSGIKNSTITSTGSYVGGVRGLLSYSGVSQCYCLDTDIKGANYVGGLAGGHQSVSSTVSYSMTNANITATNSSAGGILGYANNTNTTKDDNKIYLYYNIVANAKVTSKSNAGGMIGRVDAPIYPGHMYSNVINADIINTESTSGHGFVIGSGDYYANLVNNYRVSSNTTLNGESVKLKEGITASNMINPSLLSTQSTYTNISFSTSYFNFDKLSSGYYPYIKTINSNYYAYFKLPETSTLNTYNMALRTYSAKNLHLLPTFDVYPSDVNKINVEFNEIDPLTTFTINNKTYNIEKKVYTFYYNYTDDLNIIINDGINFKKYKFESDALSNKVYVNKDLYYFIKDKKLTTNDKIKNNNNIVNLYDNELLLENGDIISLKEDKKIGKNTKNIIECSASPLYTFTYNSNYIETFYNFSKINGEENNNLIFVKNSNIEMLSGTMNTYRQSMIIDNYNDNNYMVTLSKDGYIYNLKDKVKFPSKFDNNKIIGMNNNLYSDTNYIALVYENGTFIVFNYHTGKMVYTNYKNTDNFIEYYVSKIIGNGYKEEEYNTTKSYNESSKLVNKLEIKPITETKENEEISYKQVYNNSKKSYDIIEITNTDNKKLTNKDLNTKINEEINSNISLYNYYYSNNNKSNAINKVFEIIIFITLLIGVLTASIILGINIKKKNENTN